MKCMFLFKNYNVKCLYYFKLLWIIRLLKKKGGGLGNRVLMWFTDPKSVMWVESEY